MSGPAGGYDFDAKRLYRMRVWNAVEQFLKIPRWLTGVAYLDTAEGLETRFLLARGYNPANLHAINNNPAEMAVLTRRLRAAGVTDVVTHGLDFVEALQRTNARVHAVNFDGVSNLSDQHLAMLSTITPHIVPGVMAVNVLAGREQKRTAVSVQLSAAADRGTLCRRRSDSHGQPLRETHLQRISMLANAVTRRQKGEAFQCQAHIEDLRCGSYVSTSQQPMLWSVMKLVPHDDLYATNYAYLRGGHSPVLSDSFLRQLARNLQNGWLPTCCISADVNLMALPGAVRHS